MKVKERIKKFFKERKPEDLLVAVVPAAVVGFYYSKKCRGLKVDQIEVGTYLPTNEEVTRITLMNGEIQNYVMTHYQPE